MGTAGWRIIWKKIIIIIIIIIMIIIITTDGDNNYNRWKGGNCSKSWESVEVISREAVLGER